MKASRVSPDNPVKGSNSRTNAPKTVIPMKNLPVKKTVSKAKAVKRKTKTVPAGEEESDEEGEGEEDGEGEGEDGEEEGDSGSGGMSQQEGRSLLRSMENNRKNLRDKLMKDRKNDAKKKGRNARGVKDR